MPLDTSMVGASTEALTHDVDARWIMSYAAGLADQNPRYLDTQGHGTHGDLRLRRAACGLAGSIEGRRAACSGDSPLGVSRRGSEPGASVARFVR